MKRWVVPLACTLLCCLVSAAPLWAQVADSKPPSLTELQASLDKANAAISEAKSGAKLSADTMWVMITAMLVFFMNLGFACVESGFCRAKNCVNILSKNFIVFAATTIGFWFIGWGIMFGNGNPWIGQQGLLMVEGPDNSPATGSLAATIKGDIKSKYFPDMDDEALKKELESDTYAKLTDAIAAVAEDPAKSTVKLKEKGDDGKEIEKAVIKVKLDVPGKGAFENDYDPGAAYAGAYSALSWTGVPLWAKFFFQLVFAGTAATIVSGAVAERIKYHSFILFSFIMAIFIYPVVGHWVWGGGVLQSKGFLDFAGSTQVHSIGGWAALAGILILGPRIGKYGPDGKVNAIPGHNLTAATIGCFVLWFGWFGFNPGSTMAADGAAIAEVAITTNLAAAAATLTATLTAWIILGKPDLGMTLNGCLAGLVAITAPCAFVTAGASVIIGAVAGVLVVLAVMMFDRLHIDDPVGATSVHLVNGVFGTICVGLFATPDRLVRAGNPEAVAGLFYGGGAKQLVTQLMGVGYTAAYVLVAALAAWIILKYTVGIRVSADEEMEGLDLGEHGNEAYFGFVMAREMTTGGAEPRAALLPPGGKRFAVVVDGVSNGDLMHAWSEMCQPTKNGDGELFRDVYANMTTVQGNHFHFRGGDPEVMKGSLQKLLQDKVKGKLHVHVLG
jgi:Amt family ammonium transporter